MCTLWYGMCQGGGRLRYVAMWVMVGHSGVGTGYAALAAGACGRRAMWGRTGYAVLAAG